MYASCVAPLPVSTPSTHAVCVSLPLGPSTPLDPKVRMLVLHPSSPERKSDPELSTALVSFLLSFLPWPRFNAQDISPTLITPCGEVCLSLCPVSTQTPNSLFGFIIKTSTWKSLITVLQGVLAQSKTSVTISDPRK